MINQEMLTETISGRGDIIRHQIIFEAEVIPQFIPRQPHTIKAIIYSAKPRHIPCCPIEVVPLLASRPLLLSSHLRHLHVLMLFICTSANPAHR